MDYEFKSRHRHYSNKIMKDKEYRFQRDMIYKKRLASLADITGRYYGAAIKVDEYGNYTDGGVEGDDYSYVKRLYNEANGHYKEQYNKKIRRYQGEIPSGGAYKRIYDFC